MHSASSSTNLEYLPVHVNTVGENSKHLSHSTGHPARIVCAYSFECMLELSLSLRGYILNYCLYVAATSICTGNALTSSLRANVQDIRSIHTLGTSLKLPCGDVELSRRLSRRRHQEGVLPTTNDESRSRCSIVGKGRDDARFQGSLPAKGKTVDHRGELCRVPKIQNPFSYNVQGTRTECILHHVNASSFTRWHQCSRFLSINGLQQK